MNPKKGRESCLTCIRTSGWGRRRCISWRRRSAGARSWPSLGPWRRTRAWNRALWDSWEQVKELLVHHVELSFKAKDVTEQGKHLSWQEAGMLKSVWGVSDWMTWVWILLLVLYYYFLNIGLRGLFFWTEVSKNTNHYGWHFTTIVKIATSTE